MWRRRELKPAPPARRFRISRVTLQWRMLIAVHVGRGFRYRAAMDQVFGIFPTPFMRAPGALGQPLVSQLVQHFSEKATRDNSSSANLSHTAMLQPGDSPLLVDAAKLITPKLVEFGS